MLTHPIVQIAYFVGDARAAARRLVDAVGAGPFFVIDEIELAWGEHRGTRCDFLHTSAYGQWGSLMVECVQQDREGPSPFRDMYAPGEEGVHHVAMMVDSLPDAIAHFAALGMDLAARAETTTGTEFAFVDATTQLGHMVEIYEGTDRLRSFYERVRSSAVGWDGTDPIRSAEMRR